MSQIDKNTVSAENQLNGTEPIFFENAQGCGVRVLFVGNSITLHGYKPEIGWYGENYGMAASKKENDYVHIVMREILKRDPNAAFCICQASQWELNYADGQKVVEKLDLYKKIKDFKADIIVMRIVDNCPREKFDKAAFIKAYNALIDYINEKKDAKIILTTGFWKHPADSSILEIGRKRGFKTIYLGELGEDDKMKAIGKFEHTDVANHPGDKGMKCIADMILKALYSEEH